ncbi:glycoside hydrolase family 3 C-terminal domain-containing protein [Salipaludibacillus sp. LMS25]|jgi:beta-glucosidase|uniref:beta-glucosidase n=1 Tax=Salipaludibacillus sp. LMS25 TaxID=2924031 RepID=UPI0020D00EA5|nr:glycoside hydrolase family 3 C-terminal domain-containing protein [Salipaludibacillus sp. LMS25]UTR13776.1 glycoside hydrolase family 3 C-terminal domain-containing protein [Salipaludibacillus sp. LMS25]
MLYGKKKVILIFIIILFFLCGWIGNIVVFAETSNQINISETPKLTNEKSIEKVINEMTLEEKAKMVVGRGMPGMFGNPKAEIAGAVGVTHGIERLGIPPLFFADGPAGLRISPFREGDPHTYYATAFPIETSLASTWNKNLVTKVGKAIGNEVKEYGLDILLAPALNLHRNPLGGRNFEYFSEDPLLTGKMAVAYINGVQSNDVGATVKHFVANNQETNRMDIDTIVSQRALRELYLKGFEIAIKEANPWAVMSAYNKVNSTHASENKELLTTVLRDDWDFKGFVMTDWFAGTDPIAQMTAGNDLIMPGDSITLTEVIDTLENSTVDEKILDRDHITEIMNAVKNGTLDERILDRNISKILQIVVKTPSFKGYQHSDNPNLQKNAEISRQAGSEGMVLLKNIHKTLPLNENAKIGLFGNTQIETIRGGIGSGYVNAPYTISIADGLKNRGFNVNNDLLKSYKNYITTLRQQEEYKIKPSFLGSEFGLEIPTIPEKPLKAKEINKIVKETDVGVVVIGRISGEFEDRKNEKGDFLLTDREQDIITNVTNEYHASGKKVIVILNIGAPIEVASWRDKPDAILLAWQPGQEAGFAVADVISGLVNPSGKLPTTFPMAYNDVPSAKNFPGTPEENPEKVVYEEDIFMGYRYFTTFDIEPAYEFGYGLSYTTFHFPKVKVKKSKDKVKVSVTVENSGNITGREVVQVYLSAPDNKLEKPAIELKAFGKTKQLKPKQKDTLKFHLDVKDLASFDEERSAWVVEKGSYQIKVGASSENIYETVIFEVEEDMVVEKVNDVLRPKMEINKFSK